MDYMYVDRLTGMKSDELVKVSQDREARCELVVVCVDPQSPDYFLCIFSYRSSVEGSSGS